MGRAIEQGTDPPVGSEICATIRVAGPAGIGVARRLIEIDSKPYLLLDRKVYPVGARKPFRRPAVAAGVAPKFLGIESHAHVTRHDTADQRGRPKRASRVDGDAFCRPRKGGEIAVMRDQTEAQRVDGGRNLHRVGQPQSGTSAYAGGAMRNLGIQVDHTPRGRREDLSVVVGYRFVSCSERAGKDLDKGNRGDYELVVALFGPFEDRHEARSKNGMIFEHVDDWSAVDNEPTARWKFENVLYSHSSLNRSMYRATSP